MTATSDAKIEQLAALIGARVAVLLQCKRLVQEGNLGYEFTETNEGELGALQDVMKLLEN